MRLCEAADRQGDCVELLRSAVGGGNHHHGGTALHDHRQRGGRDFHGHSVGRKCDLAVSKRLEFGWCRNGGCVHDRLGICHSTWHCRGLETGRRFASCRRFGSGLAGCRGGWACFSRAARLATHRFVGLARDRHRGHAVLGARAANSVLLAGVEFAVFPDAFHSAGAVLVIALGAVLVLGARSDAEAVQGHASMT